MDISWDKVLWHVTHLVGFMGQTIKSDSKITLPDSIGDTIHMVELFIVYATSPYNCIMGRPITRQSLHL